LIGFLVPLTDNDKALITDAAALAVERINNDSSLLQGSQLESVFAEADCSAPAALAALSKLLEEGPLAAVIGPGCSSACEATGFLTAGRDLPQISYGCLSPSLADKNAYPTVRVDASCLLPQRVDR
jgi:ABC-type branched-subunit amino acid transport system substrate-binding protein